MVLEGNKTTSKKLVLCKPASTNRTCSQSRKLRYRVQGRRAADSTRTEQRSTLQRAPESEGLRPRDRDHLRAKEAQANGSLCDQHSKHSLESSKTSCPLTRPTFYHKTCKRDHEAPRGRRKQRNDVFHICFATFRGVDSNLHNYYKQLLSRSFVQSTRAEHMVGE